MGVIKTLLLGLGQTDTFLMNKYNGESMKSRILITILLLAVSSFCDGLFIPSEKQEVNAFWEMERIILTEASADAKSIYPKVISSYISMLFANADCSNDVIRITQFMSYSDAKAELFVDDMIQFILSGSEAFAQSYEQMSSDLRKYLDGVILDFMSPEKRRQAAKLYPNIDVFKK